MSSPFTGCNGFFVIPRVLILPTCHIVDASLTSNGFYTDSLLTVNGCDSVVTLDLTINNSSEQWWLKQVIAYDSAVADEPYWIGLNDRGPDEGVFYWASGEAVTYTAWSPRYGQPDDWYGEDCVEINRWGDPPGSADWNDLECTDDLRYICEANP